VPELSVPHTSASDPSRRVLVAEDNVINQRVAVAMLRHLGFDVDVVADGADAVRAAVATHYRLILMDCQLPGLDGYRATAEIRRLQEPPRRTPVIAVTGSEAAADRQRCLAAGMDDHVAKPLRLKALTSLISRWAPQGPPASVTDEPAEPSKVNGSAADPDRAVQLLGVEDLAGVMDDHAQPDPLLVHGHAPGTERRQEGLDPKKNPGQVPLNDPESRVMPNKEGGYAPNYTPTATTDGHAGFIVDCEVLSAVN